MDFVKALQYIRMCEKYLAALAAGEKRKAQTALDSMRYVGAPHPSFNVESPEILRKVVKRFKIKFQAELENKEMRAILELEQPYIFAREKERKISRTSELSMSARIDKLLADKLDPGPDLIFQKKLLDAQWKAIKLLVKGETPKKLILGIKRARKRLYDIRTL